MLGAAGEEPGDPAPQARGIQAVRLAMLGRRSVAPQLLGGLAEGEQPARSVAQRLGEGRKRRPLESRLDQDRGGAAGSLAQRVAVERTGGDGVEDRDPEIGGGEDRGLIASRRTSGNQRRYPRATLRRVSVIKAAQQLGLSLDEIARAMEALPDRRTPNRKDWERMSRSWRRLLDERIAALERLRDTLDGCIGCGCLSLDTCALFNQDDVLAARGPGPRILLGDAGGLLGSTGKPVG